ncbi:MAG TPA: MFS transporter [Mycobacteriales bacterium]|nr:MFS transporter [Mycobacteriales bacterium]
MDDRPATYRDVFAVNEYVHLFTANALSQLGDQLAKVALTFLVFDRTGSPVLSAAAFAVSFVPWVVGGPLLSAYADRLPRRTVTIVCDVIRAVLVATLAIPGVPVGALIGILFVANIFSPPFSSARAAMMPDVLEGDRYVVGNGLDNVTGQLCQVLGFALGGPAIHALTAPGALLADSGTFVLSALLLAVGVKHRPAVTASVGMGLGSILRASASGAAFVFRSRRLRAYLLLFWLASAFSFSVEGLVAPLSAELNGGPNVGGVLLAVPPMGVALGGVIVVRMCAPSLRIRLTLPLAVLACSALIPIVWSPPLGVVLALLALMGFGNSFALPLNPLFVRAVPTEYRGRAMGVAVSGQNVCLGLAMFLAGLLAERLSPTVVIGLSGLVGTLVVFGLATIWPHPTFRTDAASSATGPSGEAAA